MIDTVMCDILTSLWFILCNINSVSVCLLSSKCVSSGFRRFTICEFQVFKTISSGQIALCNGQMLPESNCFSLVFPLAMVESSSNDGLSNCKRFLAIWLIHSSVCHKIFVCVLWSFVQLFGLVAYFLFLF